MIPFSKYHGCGNSFIIVDEQDVKEKEYACLAKKICDRDIGIGADGCIVVKQNPLEMVFYNQDGSYSPMCGNGIRCFAKYVIDKGYTKEKQFPVITGAGELQITAINTDPFRVRINMGKPIHDIAALRLNPQMEVVNPLRHYAIDDMYTIHSVFMGTIHTVVFVNCLEKVDVEKEGYYLCHHPLFSEQSNINFVEIVDAQNAKVMTYERGVGVTKACGTGCCASVLIANDIKHCQPTMNVHLPLGMLRIELQDDVYMEGPAETIAQGTFEEEETC